MRISDWSSDVCSSDLGLCVAGAAATLLGAGWFSDRLYTRERPGQLAYRMDDMPPRVDMAAIQRDWPASFSEPGERSEEHTSELQSLMRISYAVFCLKKKKETNQHNESRLLL